MPPTSRAAGPRRGARTAAGSAAAEAAGGSEGLVLTLLSCWLNCFAAPKDVLLGHLLAVSLGLAIDPSCHRAIALRLRSGPGLRSSRSSGCSAL